MNMHDFKKSVYSALVFFSTLVVLSVVYATYQTILSSEYTSGAPLTQSLFGKVVSNLTDLNTRLSNAETNGGIVPTGAIMAFNLATCPTGWTEYAAARGRFLRGLDNGAGNDPDCASRTGGCVVGSIQGDELKSHTHTYTALLNAGPNQAFINQGSAWGNWGPWSSGATGGSETRPKNVMVLFCSKN